MAKINTFRKREKAGEIMQDKTWQQERGREQKQENKKKDKAWEKERVRERKRNKIKPHGGKIGLQKQRNSDKEQRTCIPRFINMTSFWIFTVFKNSLQALKISGNFHEVMLYFIFSWKNPKFEKIYLK